MGLSVETIDFHKICVLMIAILFGQISTENIKEIIEIFESIQWKACLSVLAAFALFGGQNVMKEMVPRSRTVIDIDFVDQVAAGVVSILKIETRRQWRTIPIQRCHVVVISVIRRRKILNVLVFLVQ